LTVRTNTEVATIKPCKSPGTSSLFEIRLGQAGASMRARHVIWAAGEFQYPKKSGSLPGDNLCMHNSHVQSWTELAGDDFVLIGGYESGVDAAVNLASAGKRCTVLASTPFWQVATADPSTELAPYTADRLRVACNGNGTPKPRLLAPIKATSVEKATHGNGYVVRAKWKEAVDNSQAHPEEEAPIWRLRKPHQIQGETCSADKIGSELEIHTPQPPILCIGFEGSVAAGPAQNLFEWRDDGVALLTDQDESTKVPGLFLAGPSVMHDDLSFCFVYKFRQRFGIVADTICRALGRDTAEAVERCRETNMYLDDLSCCEGACGETC